MHSILSFLALVYTMTQASGAVLPRAQEPCPNYELLGEVVNEYIIALHSHHNLDDHFRNIGMTFSQERTDMFFPLNAMNSYRARLTEDFVHNVIRFDPGVHSVERGLVLLVDNSNDTYHDELQNKPPKRLPSLTSGGGP